ncbi:MAG: heavy metal translocating P-type ATPase, partial [Chloroflexi bacterium]|nr:heavy metal translocating P-type ATPase [Chloroflexota bacterium]
MATAASVKKITLGIEGMTCASCVMHVENALKEVPGVVSTQVNLATEKATVEIQEGVALSALAHAVADAGYGTRSEKATVKVGGVEEPAEAARLEQALRSLLGVRAATVNPANGQVMVEYLAGVLETGDLKVVVEGMGFRYMGVEEEFDQHALAKAEEAAHLRKKFLVALAGGAVVTALSMLYMVPGFQFLPPQPFNVLLFLIATPVQFWAGSQFYTGAWAALKHKTSNMNTLIAVGTSAAYLYSVAVTLFESFFEPLHAYHAHPLFGHSTGTYYDTATIIIALILLGRFLEARARGQTSEALKKLMGMQAKTARVVRAGEELEVPIDQVIPGDVVTVRPGEKVPVDGVVLEGRSAVDES